MSDLSAPARKALEAVRALKLGQAHGFENDGVAAFTIVMDHAPSATEQRLKKLAERVEAHGYRVTERTIHQATLRVTCRPSVRNIGVVVRAARDGDTKLLILGGTLNAGLWRIKDHNLQPGQREHSLFTQPGDEVVLWRDLHAGKPSEWVSAFRNRTLDALPLDRALGRA